MAETAVCGKWRGAVAERLQRKDLSCLVLDYTYWCVALRCVVTRERGEEDGLMLTVRRLTPLRSHKQHTIGGSTCWSGSSLTRWVRGNLYVCGNACGDVWVVNGAAPGCLTPRCRLCMSVNQQQVFSIVATVHGGKTYGELAQNHWAEIGEMRWVEMRWDKEGWGGDGGDFDVFVEGKWRVASHHTRMLRRERTD